MITKVLVYDELPTNIKELMLFLGRELGKLPREDMHLAELDLRPCCSCNSGIPWIEVDIIHGN